MEKKTKNIVELPTTMPLFDTDEVKGSHEFGGIWTKDKLDALQKYLSSFTKVMSSQTWCRKIYIDAYAGTGECDIKAGNNTFTIAGSAKLGLDADPTFDQVVFIEQNSKRYNELLKLKNAYSYLKIDVYRGDANEQLPIILKSHISNGHRGVIFIDPYGMNIEWKVLCQIAQTGKLDVWYLFPLSGLYRQAAKKEIKVDQGKEASLDRLLGEGFWRDELYLTPPIQDIFGHEQVRERTTDVKGLVKFATDRLGTIFPYVSKPMILPKTGKPKFALYFAVSNSSKRAQEVAIRISNHILTSTG